MKLNNLVSACFCVLLVFVFSCKAQTKDKGTILYFHGKIVEDQGTSAISDKFGEYDFDAIVRAFKKVGFHTIADVRSKDTDILQYARQQAVYIESLIKAGLSPSDITLVGASKGASIAIQIQSLLKNSQIKSVLLAGMFKSTVNNPKTKLYGKVLSIHDTSDSLVIDPQPLISRSDELVSFKELTTNLKVGHGLLFKPYPEWLNPALGWIRTQEAKNVP